MEARTIGYWVATGLFGAVYLASGTADLLHAAPVLATLARLGYPAYVASILGPWKVAGAITILAPRARQLKEWAYAGAVFDLASGAASHLYAGDPLWRPLLPVALILILMTSYRLRPAARKLDFASELASPALAA